VDAGEPILGTSVEFGEVGEVRCGDEHTGPVRRRYVVLHGRSHLCGGDVLGWVETCMCGSFTYDVEPVKCKKCGMMLED
jgi:hypothetical protein